MTQPPRPSDTKLILVTPKGTITRHHFFHGAGRRKEERERETYTERVVGTTWDRGARSADISMTHVRGSRAGTFLQIRFPGGARRGRAVAGTARVTRGGGGGKVTGARYLDSRASYLVGSSSVVRYRGNGGDDGGGRFCVPAGCRPYGEHRCATRPTRGTPRIGKPARAVTARSAADSLFAERGTLICPPFAHPDANLRVPIVSRRGSIYGARAPAVEIQ